MTDKNLWGNTDDFADVPKFLQPKVTFDGSSADVIATNVITVPSHPFENGDTVKYTSTSAATNLSNGGSFIVLARTADTFKLAATGAPTVVLALSNDGAAGDGLQKVATDCYFVDTDEAGVGYDQGTNNAGWNLYSTYNAADGSGGTIARHKGECIVAMGVNAATAGDAEDTVTVDSNVTISAEPASASFVNGTTATFSVTAASNNPDAVLSYVWTFDASGGTPATAITNANHPGFAVADNGTLSFTAAHPAQNGDTYRVVVTATLPGGATATATSATATLTTTAS